MCKIVQIHMQKNMPGGKKVILSGCFLYRKFINRLALAAVCVKLYRFACRIVHKSTSLLYRYKAEFCQSQPIYELL